MIWQAAPSEWLDANRARLSWELDRLSRRLLPAEDTNINPAPVPDTLDSPVPINLLAHTFGLSQFERDLVLLCAGVELDAGLAARCAAASGRREVTFGLALAALEAPHWSAISPDGPLRLWRLVELDASGSLTSAPLRLDERILHFLIGLNQLDVRLRTQLKACETPSLMATEHKRIAAQLADAWVTVERPGVLAQLTGDDLTGARDVAALAAARLGLRAYTLSAEAIPMGAGELETLALLWAREAALGLAALAVECDGVSPQLLNKVLDLLVGPIAVIARHPGRLPRPGPIYFLSKPARAEQRRLWRQALPQAEPQLQACIDDMVERRRLSASAIAAAGASIRNSLVLGQPVEAAFLNGCHGAREVAPLDDLAEKITCSAGWKDLVLPEPQLAMLRQIPAQVRQRRRVLVDWNFGRHQVRGMGVTALFAGPSGTGKTLAAEVLANELKLDLYKIDLSMVINKYIGETEKNLRRVFDAAEDSDAILLFDEADALFGKRSDVKDSHDRYANIEVSYLLQRMEGYRGLAVLTTNLKAALDPAFQRRLRFIVHFPFPDATQREAIWRCVIPAAAPTEGLDFTKLARLNVTGGAVRNVALNAAFLAAEAGEPISMHHLLAAAHTESAKTDRPLTAAEMRGWA